MARYKPYEKYKDSGVEWIGQIPEHWEVVKMKNLVDIRDGTHDTPEYVDEGENTVPLVTSKNIIEGNICFAMAKHISYEDYIIINRRSNVKCGDIIMPMIGTVGNAAIVDTSSGQVQFCL
jgi:type I restriction enzyme S subunit